MRIGVQALMHAPWATEQVTTATAVPAPRVNVPAACSVTGCSLLCVALCALPLLTRDEAEGTEADAVAGVAGRVAQTPGDGAGGDRRGEDGQRERDIGLHCGCWVYVVLWFSVRGS